MTASDDRPSDRREAFPNAVLGDGSMLVNLSRRGEVEQLFWPHVDRDPHLGELRLVLVADGKATWLDDPSLSHEQRYDGDADVLVTEVTGGAVGRVTITDVVDDGAPVLVRRVVADHGRVGVFARPELAGLVRAGGAYVDPRRGVLVCHRRDRVLAIATDVAATAGVGERHRDESTRPALLAGALAGGGVVHGDVDGALLTDAHTAEVTIAIAVADTHRAAISRAVGALDRGFDAVVAARRAADAATLALATPVLVDGEAGRLDRRSQLVFSRVADAATGGVLAAPEVDPDFARSGGYGFVWPRDLAFILFAQLAAGRADLAVPALRWLVRAQGSDGLWQQRQWTDGSLAPSWGLQLDETGAVLAAYEQAWRTLQDPDLDALLWPSAMRAADALVDVLDPATGLPAPSMDLWEERRGVHTFTAATTYAGLRAAADLAARHEPSREAGFAAAADRVLDGIQAHLWSEEHGRYLRSIDVARDDAAGAPVPPSYDLLPGHPAFPVASVDPVDAVVDVALLGLAYPFGVLPADDPRMAATIAAVETELRAPDGGILRYVGDEYEGGNPWVLATLWLGLATRRPGADEPAAGIDYALRARTSTGLLPEQVDAATGRPAWIVPLTWSHAMYVLACRPDPAGLPSARLAAQRTSS